MILIIKDLSDHYKSEKKNILVKDLHSYFLARKVFRESYLLNENLEIIIKKGNFYDFFIDIEEYPDVQKKEFLLEEKNHNEAMLILNELSSNKNLFLLLDSIIKIEKEEKNIWIPMIIGKYFSELPLCFQEKLKKEPKNFLQFLVSGLLFSSYKEYNYNIFMELENPETYIFFKNNNNLKKEFIEAKGNLIEYIEKTNIILNNNYEKISTFMEFSMSNFLEEVSGELEFEKIFYLQKVFEELNYTNIYDKLKENFIKFKKIFNIANLDIELLIKNLEIIKKIDYKKFETLTDWQEFFKNEYIKYNSFIIEENVIENIVKIEKKYNVSLLGLKNSILNIWGSINKEFEEFYLKNYNSLNSSVEKKGLDYILEENQKYLDENKKTLFIFIDCLRYDIWVGVKKIFEDKNYKCQNNKIVLSAIPTVTSYCKKILYYGKKYNQIENNDYLLGLKNIFLGKRLKKIENIFELLKEKENFDHFLYEILDMDHLCHNIKDLDKEYLESNLKFKLDKFLLEINPEEFNIVIMTDHGSIKLEKDGLKSLELKKYLLENSLEMENHGKYIKIYKETYDEEIYYDLKSKLKEKDCYYIIERENMSKYYLPLAEKNKENYFFLLYKNNYFPKKTGEYTHGGISLEEVMIPFAIYSTNIKKYNPISIEIKNNTIEKDKYSMIKLLIKNSNELHKIKIKLKYQDKEVNIDFLEGNKIIEIGVKISDRVGKIKEIIETEFYFQNEKKEVKIPLEIDISENHLAEFNKKIKNNREILF